MPLTLAQLLPTDPSEGAYLLDFVSYDPSIHRRWHGLLHSLLKCIKTVELYYIQSTVNVWNDDDSKQFYMLIT